MLGDWQPVLQQQDLGSADLTMKWPVFTECKLNLVVTAARLKYSASQTQTESTREELLASLTEAYFRVRMASEALDLRQRVKNSVKVHANNAEKLFKNRMTPKVELLFLSVVFLTGLFRYREGASMGLFFITLPMLSDLSYPIEGFPPFFQKLSWVFPSTWGVRGFVKLTQMGVPLQDVAGSLPQALVYYILASVVLKGLVRSAWYTS
ncbi:TolC family protein [Pontibacter oryzae]|uniref:TolC family protein n=1 Tax=Pontibacter oryzae TaxID=2304593 RepID=UPI00131506B3|nr:TolC family protein [Pontibacter oryzae]